MINEHGVKLIQFPDDVLITLKKNTPMKLLMKLFQRTRPVRRFMRISLTLKRMSLHGQRFLRLPITRPFNFKKKDWGRKLPFFL